MRQRLHPMRGRTRLLVTVVCAVLSTACAAPPDRQANVEVLWDTWGVPHIFAPDDQALYYGLGWVQMSSHAHVMLRMYGQARGRAAEYWGEDYVESDIAVHRLRVVERAEEWLAVQDPDFLGLLEAFVAGINDFAAAHAEQIPADLGAILPVTVVDLFSHQQRAGVLPFAFASLQATTEEWQSRGSNAWAIAPSNSASGNAMLVTNPHIPWGDLGHGGLFRIMEIQATTPGNSFYGGSQIALPGVGGGFNDHMGYSGTVNTLDSVDTYELNLVEGGYLWNGEVRPFERHDRTIQVLGDDGTPRSRNIEVKWSVHGPVFAEQQNRALAVRLADYRQSHQLEQLWRMSKVRNLAEFKSVVSQLQMPKSNLLYADRNGDIYYVANGMIPNRGTGDAEFWRGIVPGEGSETLWDETLAFDQLPQLENPVTGWLQNANDPPWSAAMPFSIDPKDYPLALSPLRIGLRAQRSIAMISQKPKLSFDDVVAYKSSTRLLLADRVLGDLASAVARHGTERAREAVQVLMDWDRHTDNDSRGAVLFVNWADKAGFSGNEAQVTAFATGWDPRRPLATPYGLADGEQAALALDAAAEEVEAAYGSLDVAYGEVYRLRWANGIDLPGNGAPGSLGAFRVTNFLPDSDGRYRAFAGDSLVFIVEFSEPVRAQAILSYGNSSVKDSPHNGDQLELYSDKRMRPVWRSRAEIEANLSRRESLHFEPG